jgi:predicted Zn-dependent protease
MTRLLRHVGATLLCVLPALAPGCGGGSSAQRPREVILETEADDRRVGEQASLQVGGQMGIVNDPDLAAYVSAVGQRLARHAPRGRYQYQFAVVDQDAPNAFALPGGYIYVSRGLLVLANSEDELAGVLGHEIIHVAARHAAARQAMMQGLGPLQFMAGGFVAGYGRDQERESDRLGQGLAGLAGYDPQGLPDFLRGLEFETRLQLGASRLPGFYDTHPATSERIASASSRARMVAWKRVPLIAGGHAGYLARLDGLVVGTGADQGVFRGSLFMHPDMGFSIRFPSGWRTVNTRQAVGATSPRNDGVVFLEHQSFGDDPEQAATVFLAGARQQGLGVDKLERIKVGGLPAVRATGRARATPVQLTWIAYRGSVYRVTGMSRTPGQFEGTFRNVARSFRPLSAEARRSIQQKRLRIASARRGESLQDLSQRTGNTWDVQQTAVVNGFFATEQLEPGQLVKVAVAEEYAAPKPAR